MSHPEIEPLSALEGAVIVAPDRAPWGGEGAIGIANVAAGDPVRFDLLLPTVPQDRDGFIWPDEAAAGTTGKVVLVHDDQHLVQGARVVGVVREGPDPDLAAAPAHRYRIGFEVPAASLRAAGPNLGVALCWHEPLPAAEGEPLAWGDWFAFAISSRVAEGRANPA